MWQTRVVERTMTQGSKQRHRSSENFQRAIVVELPNIGLRQGRDVSIKAMGVPDGPLGQCAKTVELPEHCRVEVDDRGVYMPALDLHNQPGE
jgi:hypothetical protein